FTDKILSLKYTWPTVLLFLVVLGGIYRGIFTPTEAGAIGAFGAIIISIAMGRLNFRKFLEALLEAGQTTAFIMLLIIGAYILMKFLAVSKLTLLLGATVANSTRASHGHFRRYSHPVHHSGYVPGHCFCCHTHYPRSLPRCFNHRV
ncbi:TRAP transporter large permease subunit, partial [bacterium]|nr:TRAP transporter large permease subunit [bacterium]